MQKYKQLLLTDVSGNQPTGNQVPNHVYISQGFLSLTENKRFRTSQLTSSGGTLCEIHKNFGKY